MKLQRLLVPVAVTLLVGCSNDPVDEPTTSDLGRDAAAPVADMRQTDAGGDAAEADMSLPAVDARDYCEATVDMFCDYYLRCGRIDATGPDDCREKFLETCNGVFEPQYAALADRGQLSVSPEGIAACAAHLESVQCERQIFDLDGPCRAVWDGQAPAGSACAPGVGIFVCEAGTECVLDLSLCGTCEPAGTAGAPCVDGRCDRESRCIDDECVARGLTGDACDDERICATGLACVDGSCSAFAVADPGGSCTDARCPYQSTCLSGVCVPDARNGDSCEAGEVCGAGFCDGTTCQPFREDGGACGDNTQCLSGRCENATCAPTVSMCFGTP